MKQRTGNSAEQAAMLNVLVVSLPAMSTNNVQRQVIYKLLYCIKAQALDFI